MSKLRHNYLRMHTRNWKSDVQFKFYLYFWHYIPKPNFTTFFRIRIIHIKWYFIIIVQMLKFSSLYHLHIWIDTHNKLKCCSNRNYYYLRKINECNLKPTLIFGLAFVTSQEPSRAAMIKYLIRISSKLVEFSSE